MSRSHPANRIAKILESDLPTLRERRAVIATALLLLDDGEAARALLNADVPARPEKWAPSANPMSDV